MANPDTSRDSKEFLKFCIDQMYLNNQDLINNILCTRTAHRLGISAKKATISSNDFLSTAGVALEEFPVSHQCLRDSLLEQSVATSRLDSELDSFFTSAEDSCPPEMMEAAGKLTEKWSGLSDQITILLGQLSSSDTSGKLLDSSESFEESCAELNRAVFSVEVSSADKLISSALCSVNQHSQSNLSQPEQAEAQKAVINLTKNIYRKTQGVLNDLNMKEMKDTKLSKSVLELAADYERLVKNLANISDTEETKPWVHSLGKSLILLSEYIENDTDDLEPFTLKTVGEPCTKILTTLNESAKRNQVFENVSREFRGLASDIETTIMFASASPLTSEDDSEFKTSRENILKMSHDLVANIKSILTGTTEERDVLVAAVEESVKATAGLAEEVKKGAAALCETNQTGQVPTQNNYNDDNNNDDDKNDDDNNDDVCRFCCSTLSKMSPPPLLTLSCWLKLLTMSPLDIQPGKILKTKPGWIFDIWHFVPSKSFSFLECCEQRHPGLEDRQGGGGREPEVRQSPGVRPGVDGPGYPGSVQGGRGQGHLQPG